MMRIRISSRPASMPRISSHLALSGTTSKVQQGPMRGPSAGPTPPSEVAAALTASAKSSPAMLSAKDSEAALAR